MKYFANLLVLGAALVASVSVASASPITGGVTIGGNDTYTASSITFSPTTGVIVSSNGTMATAAPQFSSAALTSFSFAASNGVVLFSVPATGPTALSFTINGPLTVATVDNTGALSLKGNGTLTETGYDNTSGMFSLTSSSSGTITGFQLVSSVPVAATPEPSSLVMLGTGLISAAGMLVRRRRIV